MTWRCANKRRKRAASHPMEPHLGDIPNMDMPPMVLHRRHEPGDTVDKIKAVLFTVAGFILLCVALFVIFMFAMAASSRRVHAHDAAQWIQFGGYLNAAGELCCGERDCHELSDADVKITSAGYFIASIKETVPFDEATPSPDGKYWRCQWGGRRRCFFAPPAAPAEPEKPTQQESMF